MIYNKYKISWRHENNHGCNSSKMSTSKADNFSYTTCFIKNKETDEELCVGEATCVPTDNFNKAVGRKISFNRALKDLECDKNERKELWNEFFKFSPKSKV